MDYQYQESDINKIVEESQKIYSYGWSRVEPSKKCPCKCTKGKSDYDYAWRARGHYSDIKLVAGNDISISFYPSSVSTSISINDINSSITTNNIVISD